MVSSRSLMAQQNLYGSQVRAVFSRWVAKQCRRVWGWTSLRIPARLAASRQAVQKTLAVIG